MRSLRLISVLIILSLCASAQESSPVSPQEGMAKARAALDRGQPEQALAILQALAKIQPPIKGLQHELGIVYYRTGKLPEAREAFANAIEADASDKESVQMEGLVLYRMGKPAEAIPYLERVREWMPAANADANYVLGLCYLNAQRLDDARHAFARQYGEEPDSAAAYLLLATMLRHANRPEEAAEQAEKATALSPSLPLAHFMIGDLALSRSDAEKAIQELQAERKINPNYAPLYDRLGDAYLRIDRIEEAQQSLTRAIALDQTLTSAFANMGKLLLRVDDPHTAVMYLNHAEKMDPQDSGIHSLLAQAYHRTGQDDKAREENALASKTHVIKP
jgi:predicted Zn-dependent protease